ncbi:MAG: NAD(P)/FAD-dependent oxidoreductase, partial [Cyclonatronaceae bacterium]
MQQHDQTKQVYKHLILGGGLAGSCLALALARSGESPALLHAPHRVAASRVPLALYNPAAAMKARLGWEAVKCHETLNALIEELGRFCGGTETFVKETGVLRPCLDENMRKNFKQSLEKHAWPPGWVSWKTPEALKQEFPGVFHTFGGLWVPVGKTFNMPVLMDRLHAMLREKYGVEIIKAEISRLQAAAGTGNNGARWRLQAQKPSPEKQALRNGGKPGEAAGMQEYRAHAVIAACGSGLPQLLKAYLPDRLKTHRVKGQTLRVSRPVPQEFKPSVASKGYVAFFDEQAVVGSTYEHHFREEEALQPTEEARNRLEAKVERSFTENRAGKTGRPPQAQWAG